MDLRCCVKKKRCWLLKLITDNEGIPIKSLAYYLYYIYGLKEYNNEKV